MTDTTISGAVCFPQDSGSGVPEDEEDYSSAGFFSLLSKYKGEGSYVGEDTSGNPTLQFNDVDTSNEQVDISTGYAYIMDSMSVQSGFQTVYDVALPNESPYVVILPDEVVNLDLGTDNVNDLWLAVDPTSNDSVYIRHGNGLSAPSDPSVKLGTVDTSSGATTRTNDGAPSGAFRDENGDNVYTLPNASDGIGIGSLTGNITSSTSITDLVGSGLEISSGAFQVLSSIWDGTNIVADVDNSSVTTGSLSHEIENANDVVSSRSVGTWEQNTTGNVLFVSLGINVAPDSGTSVVRTVTRMNNSGQIDTNLSSDFVVGTGSTNGVGGPVFLVPDGAHYKVDQFGDTGDAVLQTWYEAEYTPN